MFSPLPVPRSDAALSLALHRAAQRVRDASRPVVHALGLEYEDYLALASLWSADGAEESRLAATLGVSEASVRRSLAALVARGYAEREAALGCAPRVWLTDDGHRARAVSSHALDTGVSLDEGALADTRFLLDELIRTLAPAV